MKYELELKCDSNYIKWSENTEVISRYNSYEFLLVHSTDQT